MDLERLKTLVSLPADNPTDQPEAQRLFHGRGHAFPGYAHLAIDLLPPVVLITIFQPEVRETLLELADWLQQRLPNCSAIVLQHRHERSGPMEPLLGEYDERFAITENGLKFLLRLGGNRNIGLFPDMANGRQWVRDHSRDKRVLNLFAYTCGFSVAALAGGARGVVNIDMSSAALSIGRDNHRRNGQPLDTVGFEKLDIFRSFGRIKKRGPFDLLICDPPTRQKGSVDIRRDYPKILRRLPEFMAPASDLLLCLNAPKLGREFLLDAVAAYAPQYHLHADIKPPDVFVEAEGKGLKVLHFRMRQNLESLPHTHKDHCDDTRS